VFTGEELVVITFVQAHNAVRPAVQLRKVRSVKTEVPPAFV
jgi:hypothetical protein